MRWMEAIIFSSIISVIVNGSSHVAFQVSRGLRQGDPMSPFMFMLVAEGLTGLLRNSSQLGEFRGSHVTKHIHFELL